MKNLKIYSFIVLFAMAFNQESKLGLETFIPITPAIINTKTIPESSNFNMNHGFSLMVDSGTFGSNSMGIYSNRVKYKFSDKLSLNSTFHLMNSNHSNYTNNQNFDVLYELGFEYKLSENSRIFFQFSDLLQPGNNHPYMFTPGF